MVRVASVNEGGGRNERQTDRQVGRERECGGEERDRQRGRN